MILVLFLIATIGLTNTVVHGKIFDDDHLGFRSWLRRQLERFFHSGDVLDCYECTGFWCGMITGLMLLSYNPVIFVGAGLAGVGLMHCYINIMNFIESKTDFIVGDTDDAEEHHA